MRNENESLYEYDELEEYSEDYFNHDSDASSMEGDGFYGDIPDEELQELMEKRKQRYMEGYNRPMRDTKKVNTKAMIVVLALLILYYVVAFILNVSGVISNLVRSCGLSRTEGAYLIMPVKSIKISNIFLWKVEKLPCCLNEVKVVFQTMLQRYRVIRSIAR